MEGTRVVVEGRRKETGRGAGRLFRGVVIERVRGSRPKSRAGVLQAAISGEERVRPGQGRFVVGVGSAGVFSPDREGLVSGRAWSPLHFGHKVTPQEAFARYC